MQPAASPHSKFLACILDGDRRAAEAEARRAIEQHGAPFLYESVVRAALTEVGQLWAEDRITVADEHIATATAQCALAALYPSYAWPERRGARVLVASPQGERHEIGGRMVADLLALDGWDDVFLGADVPIEALVAKAIALRPAIVALSVSLELHQRAARECISAIRAELPATRILVGGRAAMRAGDAMRACGADAVLDSAVQAVEVARAWK